MPETATTREPMFNVGDFVVCPDFRDYTIVKESTGWAAEMARWIGAYGIVTEVRENWLDLHGYYELRVAPYIDLENPERNSRFNDGDDMTTTDALSSSYTYYGDGFVWPDHLCTKFYPPWEDGDRDPAGEFAKAYAQHSERVVQERAEKRAKLRAQAKSSLEQRMRRWLHDDPRRYVRNWVNNRAKYKNDAKIYAPERKAQAEYLAMLTHYRRKFPDRQDLLALTFGTRYPAGEKDCADLNLLRDKMDMFYPAAAPVWYGTRIGFIKHLPEYTAMVPHVAEGDPMKIAYYPSVRHLREARCVVTTPGKFLTKYFSEAAMKRRGLPFTGLTELEIKAYAEKHRIKFGPIEIKWARTPEECIRAVNDGPSESCMSGKFSDRCEGETWWRGDQHPACVYGSTDTISTGIAIAYLEDENGRITARIIANTKDKRLSRGYGDYARLLQALEREGYTQQTEALVGCRIRRVEASRGGYIMPYVDAGTGSGGGYLHAATSDDIDYWVLCTSRYGTDEHKYVVSTYQGYENKGVAYGPDDEPEADEDDYFTCECCGNRYHEDARIYIDYSDEDICGDCASDTDNYVEAYTGRYRELVPRGDAEWCEDTSEFYTSEGVEWHTDRNNIGRCEIDGALYSYDNLVWTSYGLINTDSAVALDVEDSDGNAFARDEDVVKTYDGRTIHEGEAVEVEWWDGETYTLHTDDEPEDYLPEQPEEDTPVHTGEIETEEEPYAIAA